jgi:hypothetical protein
VLCINGNYATIGEVVQVDSMATAIEPHLEAMMNEAFPLHPLSGSDLGHQIHS